MISRTAAETVSDWVEKIGGRRYDYRVCPAREIDHPPVVLTAVAPHYAAAAQEFSFGDGR